MSIYEDAKQRVSRWEEICEMFDSPTDGGGEAIALAREVVRLTEVLQLIAKYGDRNAIGITATKPEGIAGWLRVDAMRELAENAIGNERTDG